MKCTKNPALSNIGSYHRRIRLFLRYKLIEGNYQPSRLMTIGDIITTNILPGFELNLGNRIRKQLIFVFIFSYLHIDDKWAVTNCGKVSLKDI